MLSLADAIIQPDLLLVKRWLTNISNLDELDEYGFTYLIEAIIVNNIEIATLLCQSGANVNQPDANGNTPFHWAVENNNIALCELLLKYNADPNAYNFAGQPVLVMPILRHQKNLLRFLHQAGAEQDFARDFINAKLLGHIFNLVGITTILSPKYDLVEVDFEGFYLETTLSLINESLMAFKNNYGGRHMKQFAPLTQVIINTVARGAMLAKYKQYQVDLSQHVTNIQQLLHQEPILLPIGYDGHAISFVKYGNIFAICDRRITEHNSATVTCFNMCNPQACTIEFMLHLLYNKHDHEFINNTIPQLLKLTPILTLPIEAQVSGNCSWANVEACIPTLFFLLLNNIAPNHMTTHQDIALKFFRFWRDWNKKRAVNFCVQSFATANAVRKAIKAEILAAILFQEYTFAQLPNQEIVSKILPLLHDAQYKYILDSYLQTYYYQTVTEEGKNFANMLKSYNLYLAK